MPPFTLRYSLTRRQRLPELLPWLPAVAGSLGFTIGVGVLAADVTAWFLLLLLVPTVAYRGLFGLAFDLAFRPAQPVEVTADDHDLEVFSGGDRRRLPLDGIIQVYRSADGTEWTVLHLDRTALTIPSAAIAIDQVEFLKGFARRAAAERKATDRDYS